MSVNYAIHDINIAKIKKNYPNVNTLPTNRFNTLDEYIEIAHKCIHYAVYDKILARELIASEDAISYIANYMMMADWRYNDTGHKQQKNFRFQAGIYGIMVYIRSATNGKNTKYLDVYKYYQFEKIGGIGIEDRRIKPSYRALVDKENLYLLKKVIKKSKLTDIQKDAIVSHFLQNEAHYEIANRWGVTRQGISDSIKKGLEKIRCNPTTKHLSSLD